MEDEGKLPVGSRFFKVLVLGFEQALRLPPIISMILNDGKIPEAVILVSRRGSWRVGVGEFKSKGLTLNGKGWDSFVRSHDLSVRHFLVFEHTGDMHFHTLVFDSTTCEKEFPDDHTHLDDKNIKRQQDKSTSASYQQKKGIFQVKLQRYNIETASPFLYIPRTFMKSNCLSENATVTLINPWGDSWKVNLKTSGRSKGNLLCGLYGGWKSSLKKTS